MQGGKKNRRALLVGAAGAGVLVLLLTTPYAHRPQGAEVRKLNALFAEPVPLPGDLIRDTTFVVFDTETTGINPHYSRMVELAAVKMYDGKVLEEKTWLINPEQFIPEEVQAIHHITPEMVADRPTFCEIYSDFASFIRDSVLVGHNVSFDVNFLRMETARCAFPLPPHPVFDSLRLFRAYFPGLKSYSLSDLADYAEVAIEGEFHRAGIDSLYTGLIVFKVIEELGPDATLEELYALAGGVVELQAIEEGSTHSSAESGGTKSE